MKPINFHERETIFTSDDPMIEPLPVLSVKYSDGERALVSCWKPSLKDIINVLIGKPIFLSLLSDFQPPCLLSTDRSEVMGHRDEQLPDLDCKFDANLRKNIQDFTPKTFILKKEMPGLPIGISFQQSAKNPNTYFYGIPVKSDDQVGIIEFDAEYVEDNPEWFEQI